MKKTSIVNIGIICLFIIYLFTNISYCNEVDYNNKKIYKNIYIENTLVGGLNYKEAKQLLKNKYKLSPIKIQYDNNTWTINPSDIELTYYIDEAIEESFLYTRSESKINNIKRYYKLTTNNNHAIKIKYTYNEHLLSEIIKKMSENINIKVVDATINITEASVIERTPSKDGLEIDEVKLKEIIYDMINSKTIKDIKLPVKVIKPTVTTEQVESIDKILGQFSTSFRETTSRGSNIHVAAKSTSDKLIMPHEEFSYNQSTGARTWANGYKSAKVIVGGKFVNGEGGGVCQVSTTIYNAALLSGLKIQEVHNHTYPSRYAPKGRDAAVSYGYTDLKFKNSNNNPIYIKNIAKNGAITTKIYGSSEDIEKVYIKTEQKYEKEKIYVKTYRVFLDEENNKIRDELIAESVYQMK